MTSYWWLLYAVTAFYSIALARCLIQRRSSPSSSSSSQSSTPTTSSSTSPSHTAAGTSSSSSSQSSSSSTTTSSVPTSLTSRPTGKPFVVKYRYVVAPMVGQCDLPFRMQCRAGGSELVYTPMFMANRFAVDASYRRHCFQTCEGDRPLAVQFGANQPLQLLAAAKFVEDYCDAVDLNLGCPQARAQEGKYGAYLLPKSNWQLVLSMVATCHQNLKIPIICKIRLLPDLNETITFCKLLEAAGCSLIAVHGRRLAGDKKRRVGPANLEAIRRIKSAVTIPVISNGNVRDYNDVKANLEKTKADGIMSAEAILANPALFSGHQPNPFVHCDQYFEACERYGAPPVKWVADHIKNFIRPMRVRGASQAMNDLRALGQVANLDDAKRLATVTEEKKDTTATTTASTGAATASTIPLRYDPIVGNDEHKRALAALAPVRKIVENLRALVAQPADNEGKNDDDVINDGGVAELWNTDETGDE